MNHPDLKVESIDGIWMQGVYKKRYEFNGKIYDVGSRFGINQGRVSKLWVSDKETHKTIFSYERGMELDHPIGHEIAAIFDKEKV